MSRAEVCRDRAIRLLLRFLCVALNMGRLPSLVGREVFGSKMAREPSCAFEESVIFVCDVEQCLAELEPFDRRLVVLCIFENRSEWEAARQLGRCQADISRLLKDCLDRLYATFVRKRLLSPPPERLFSEEPESEEGAYAP
jgi:hypothetical protein